MADKTYKSSLFKRIIDLGVVREADVDDLVRIWRVGTGDEKAITLQNFVNTVDADLGSGGLTLTEIVDIIAGELDVLAFTDLLDTPSSYVGQGGKAVSVKADETGLEFVDGGTGTTNYLAKFTASGTIGDSILIDDANGVYNTGKGNSTFFGFGAGLNDDGTNNANTFVGSQAGLSNTTGVNNSFFGRSSGENNTTGSSNSFFGLQAGLSNTTSPNNSFFGRSSGLSNTTGASNSFFGRSSGENNTTGVSNSFFGFQAGVNNTTGSSNSFFGVNAGRRISSGADLTVANNSVFLGFDTRANADSETNQIVIGYQAIGQGSNTTTIGNSSTTLTRLYGELRVQDINNLGTSPTEVLVPSATGVVSKRTLAELASDLGAVLTTGDQSIAGIKTFTTQVSVTGSFLSLASSPDNKSKLRLFGTSFEWGIGTQSATTFGRLNDTAVTFNVPNTDAIGWLWGDSGHTLPSQGSMSLTSNGNLTVANSVRIGYGESDTEDVVAYGFDHNGTARLAGIPSGTIVDTLGLDVNNQVVKGAVGGGISGLTLNRIPKATSGTTIGDSILVSDADGLYNTGKGNSTFFGFGAGRNDDGSNNINTFFGFEAGLVSIGGSGNCFFGFRTGYSNTASSNSFFGSGAGFQNTTGFANSFFGLNAGANITSGAANVFLGVESGSRTSSLAPLTLASTSVFIGPETKANADSDTNQIVIGYQAIGAGSNTVVLGNTSIIKTVLRGTINAANLPTSSAGLVTGDIWNDAGTLKIV